MIIWRQTMAAWPLTDGDLERSMLSAIPLRYTTKFCRKPMKPRRGGPKVHKIDFEMQEADTSAHASARCHGDHQDETAPNDEDLEHDVQQK